MRIVRKRRQCARPEVSGQEYPWLTGGAPTTACTTPSTALQISAPAPHTTPGAQLQVRHILLLTSMIKN